MVGNSLTEAVLESLSKPRQLQRRQQRSQQIDDAQQKLQNFMNIVAALIDKPANHAVAPASPPPSNAVGSANIGVRPRSEVAKLPGMPDDDEHTRLKLTGGHERESRDHPCKNARALTLESGLAEQKRAFASSVDAKPSRGSSL